MTEELNLELLGNKSSYSRGQYAEYGKWTHKPFLKAYCIHQNHRIERRSIGPKRFAPSLQGHSHDIFCQIYHNLSVLPHHFHIPCLHFCFLIRMVTGMVTGNLSVIFFVALLLSELNGVQSMNILGRSRGILPWENLKFRSSKTAGNAPETPILSNT